MATENTLVFNLVEPPSEGMAIFDRSHMTHQERQNFWKNAKTTLIQSGGAGLARNGQQESADIDRTTPDSMSPAHNSGTV